MEVNPKGRREDLGRDSPTAVKILPDEYVVLMRREHGYDISQYSEEFLLRSLEKRIADTQSKTAADYADRLTSDRAEARVLFESLLIHHSEFFRDSLSMALVEQLVIPCIVRDRERDEIRVWSAGCAAGEEPWSVAMLLEDAAVVLGRDIPYRIIATDASERVLSEAVGGFFKGMQIQNLRCRQVGEYFTQVPSGYSVCPRIRKRVEFSVYNLLDERTAGPPSGVFLDYDLVLCCNVLFYYRPEVRRRILQKLHGALCLNGYFLTGAVERDMVLSECAGFGRTAPPVPLFQKHGSIN